MHLTQNDLRTKINQILTEMIFSQKFSPKHSLEHLYKYIIYNAVIKRNDSNREMFVRSLIVFLLESLCIYFELFIMMS